MRKLMITILAAAALTAVPLVSATAASASVTGRGFGNGATLAIAEKNAVTDMESNWAGCVPPFRYPDYHQNADGTWWAEVVGPCQYPQ